MKCQEIKPLIFTYLDGNLSGPLERAFFGHLSNCEHCQKELDLARQTNTLLEKFCAHVEPPADFADNLMAKLDALEPEQTRNKDNIITIPAVAEPPAAKGWQRVVGHWQRGFSRVAQVASFVVLTATVGLMFFTNGGLQIARTIDGGDNHRPGYQDQEPSGAASGEVKVNSPGGSPEVTTPSGTNEPAVPSDNNPAGETDPENNNPNQGTGDSASPSTSKDPEPSEPQNQEAAPGQPEKESNADSVMLETINPIEPGPPVELNGSFEIAGHQEDKPAQEVVLAEIAVGDAVNRKAVFTDGGKRIKFLSGQIGRRLEIWQAGADGKEPKLLGTTARSVDGAAVWSLDGSKLAYLSNNGEYQAIYLDDLSGKTVNLTPFDSEAVSGKWAFAPVWSNTGEIAYLTTRAGNTDVMAAGSKGNRVIAGTEAEENSPVWSPDGGRIAYQRDQQIYIADRNGANEQAIPLQIKAKNIVMAWSPDGQYLAVSVKGDQQQGIWLVRADGSEGKRLIQIGGGADLQWSPDSRKLAFNDTEGMVYILTFKEDGSKDQLYPVTPESNGINSTYLAWSPDARQLLLEWISSESENRGIWKATLP